MNKKKLEGLFTPLPAKETGLTGNYERVDYDKPEGEIDLSRLRVVGMSEGKECILENGVWIPVPDDLREVGSLGLALGLTQAQDEGMDIFLGLEDYRFVVFSLTGLGFFYEIWQTSNPCFCRGKGGWELDFHNTRNQGHPTKRCGLVLKE